VKMTRETAAALPPRMTGRRAAWLLIGLLWAMTVAAWPLDVAVVMDRDLAPEAHGLLGGIVLTVTFAAIIATAAAIIIRCCSGPKLKPGEQIVSDQMMARIEEAAVRGAVAALRKGGEAGWSALSLAGDGGR
jgi:hypothetical protein